VGPWADRRDVVGPYPGRVRWWERVGAWDDTHRFAVDAALTVVAAFVVVPLTTDLLYNSSDSDLRYLSLVMVVPLAWRRTRPVLSVTAVYLIALGHLEPEPAENVGGLRRGNLSPEQRPLTLVAQANGLDLRDRLSGVESAWHHSGPTELDEHP